MTIERVIRGDRIFKRCPECRRYSGKVRCRYCGKEYRTPSGLFRHEKRCYSNPLGICGACRQAWNNCKCYMGDECDERERENWLAHPELLDSARYSEEGREGMRAWRDSILAEIAATTVEAGDTP